MALAVPDAVVLELMTMGQQSAAHLEDLFRSASPSSPYQELAAEILRCCNRVIAALTTANNGASGHKRKRKQAVDHEAAAAAAACSPPPSTPPRKRARGGAEALGVVTSSTTLDGFIWRKYGQKDINGRRHPRLYYRCAYSHQGCTATRRVQRTHEEGEPAAEYEVAYYGKHTCRGAATSHGAAAAVPPTVVDFGSNNNNNNAWASSAASSESEPQVWSWGGQTSQGGWSSSASSEVMGFKFAQTADEWHDTARAEEVPRATPFDPVMEFLDGCFDWESVVNVDAPFDFGALLP